MIPAVTEPPRPNGLPTATTQSPTLASSLSPMSGKLLVGIDLEEGDVGLFLPCIFFALGRRLFLQLD
jgi:hypothetical protein